MNKQILANELNELCKIANEWIKDLDTDTTNPLIVRYICADDDLTSKWDNSLVTNYETRNALLFIYNYTTNLLNSKFGSDKLSLAYKDHHTKLIYITDDQTIKATA